MGLGVLLFELLIGHAPFEAASAEKIYERIKLGIERVTFASHFPKNAERLVRQLCQFKPEKRPRSSDLVRAAWFQAFDWNALRGLGLVPPYVPEVSGARDTKNFRM